jgi:hypothetical protein
MKGLFGTTRGQRRPARAALAEVLSSFGAAGLAEAARRPALLADIDQHAAAVRDALDPTPSGSPVAPRSDLLAAYAEGVRATAVEYGWRPPSGPVDWSEPGWVVLRLVGVCALAYPAGARR